MAKQPPSQQAMLDAMAELRQLGALDQAAQDQLMCDLSKTDPSLWPLVIQQMRATVAYCKRLEERTALAAAASPPADLGAAMREAAPRTETSAYALPGTPAATLTAQRLPPTTAPETPTPVAPPTYPSAAPSPPEAAKRLPPLDERRAEAVHDENVRPVSYETTEAKTWRESLDATIRALEAEAPKSPQSQEDFARLTQLRILYLVAGKRDDALRPIPAAPPATTEFVSKSLYGLGTWLDVNRTPDATRRAGEAKQALEEAAGKLGDAAALVVRNMAFCSEIQSYGCYKAFKANEFSPDQEVLLYAEIDNFSSESTARGFHTSLRSSYQIFDARGQRVADHDFTVTEEHCQNQRRDFFIGYHLRLPKRIYSGKHTLQLTVEDLKSHKVGQSQIDFVVKETKEK